MKPSPASLILSVALIGAGYLWGVKSRPVDVHVDSGASAIQSRAAEIQNKVSSPDKGLPSKTKLITAADFFSPQKLGNIADRLNAARLLGTPHQSAAYMSVIASMAAGDTEGVFQWMTQQDGGMGRGLDERSLWQAFWMRHGEVDFDGSLARLQQHQGENLWPDHAIKHIFEGIAKSDPSKAGEALAKLENPKDVTRAVEGLAVRWAEVDAVAATQWGLQQEDEGFKRQALRAIPYGVYLKQGMKGVTDWWQNLPQEQRAEGFAMATNPIKENPDGVELKAEELWQFIEAGSAAQLSDPQLESAWVAAGARTDADATLKRLTQMPNAESLAGHFFARLAMNDGQGAMQRLSSIPPDSTLYQIALTSTAQATCRNNPELAAELIPKITDVEQRTAIENFLTQRLAQSVSESEQR